MGALNHFWSDRTVDDYSKYLIFRAIPINLLLWGSESWALRETTLGKLEVFLHRSIRKILRIDITQVMDERITNGSIRNKFFSIPTIRKQIAQQQLTFIGKVVRNKDNQLPTKQQTKTRGPPPKQQEEPSAKHTTAHTRRSKRQTTHIMGILCARGGPLEALDFTSWKQTDQMDRRGARRKLPPPFIEPTERQLAAS